MQENRACSGLGSGRRGRISARRVIGYATRFSRDVVNSKQIRRQERKTRLHEIETDAFVDQIEIHLIGAHRVANAVLPGMVSRQRGDVIFIGSDVALEPRVQMGAYGAAKAGLVAMVKTLRMELEGTGVRA